MSNGAYSCSDHPGESQEGVNSDEDTHNQQIKMIPRSFLKREREREREEGGRRGGRKGGRRGGRRGRRKGGREGGRGGAKGAE